MTAAPAVVDIFVEICVANPGVGAKRWLGQSEYPLASAGKERDGHEQRGDIVAHQKLLSSAKPVEDVVNCGTTLSA